MALDFPLAPVVGQQFPFTPVPGQPVFIWDGTKWVPAPLTGAVRYDAVQSLSESQQSQARDNIGASSGGATGAVRYDTPQTLTTPQLVQARSNIYAAPHDAMAYSGMQINGGIEVSQEIGTGATAINNSYVCDSWKLSFGGTMVLSAQQFAIIIAPGFQYFLGVSVSTAQPTLSAADFARVGHPIEGYRIARLAWGTANAQPITLGFWCAHHRAGLHSGAVQNAATTRSYVFTYTQAVADASEYKTITIPGDTTGTWNVDSATGLFISFVLAAGTTYSTAAPGVWWAGNFIAATGHVNNVGATSDAFRITGVTIHPGTQAPTAAQSPNIMRPFDQELVTCKRYWQKFTVAVDVNAVAQTIVYPVEFRVLPTVAGGGAGFAIGAAATVSGHFFQTARAFQTLTFDARL